MLNKSITRVAGVALAAGIALTASACSTPASDDSSSNSTVIAPVIVDIASLDGTTVEVSVDNVVDLVAEDVTAWSGVVADPTIAEFIPGTSEGDTADALKTNPGIQPLVEGETKVTLTSTDGTTVTFTLVVTAA